MILPNGGSEAALSGQFHPRDRRPHAAGLLMVVPTMVSVILMASCAGPANERPDTGSMRAPASSSRAGSAGGDPSAVAPLPGSVMAQSVSPGSVGGPELATRTANDVPSPQSLASTLPPAPSPTGDGVTAIGDRR